MQSDNSDINIACCLLMLFAVHDGCIVRTLVIVMVVCSAK